MEESKCRFDFIKDIDFQLKVDENQDYSKLSSYGVKAVDWFGYTDNGIFFLEVKSYSDNKLRGNETLEKLRRDLILKLLNSVSFCMLNDCCIDIKRLLFENVQLSYVIYLCPPAYGNRKFTPDRIYLYKTRVFRIVENVIKRANLNVDIQFSYFPKLPPFLENVGLL